MLVLGEEQKVNRETMSWLKEWDQCVFKRRAPKTKKRTWGESANEREEFENLDPLGRPREKVSKRLPCDFRVQGLG